MISNQKWLEERRKRGKKAILVFIIFLALTAVVGMSLGRMPVSNGMAVVVVAGLNAVLYLVMGIKDLVSCRNVTNYIADMKSIVIEQGEIRTELEYFSMLKVIAVTGKEAGMFIECRDEGVYYLDGDGIPCRKMEKLFNLLKEKVESECVVLQPDLIEWCDQSLSLFMSLLCSSLSFLLPGILCLLS